jgi:hypothetical protein
LKIINCVGTLFQVPLIVKICLCRLTKWIYNNKNITQQSRDWKAPTK